MRSQGILLIGSGAETHNLGEIFAKWRQPGFNPEEVMNKPHDSRFKTSDYVSQFIQNIESSVLETSSQRSIDNLVHYRIRTKHGKRAHPTQDHFLPFAFALGASLPDPRNAATVADDAVRSKKLYNSIEYGDMAMGIYSFY